MAVIFVFVLSTSASATNSISTTAINNTSLTMLSSTNTYALTWGWWWN
ncbi:hypothetical protein [Seonamhaeicola sp. S2-3]|nr:hypothetical protein [Seonamhaeicola sp. S2-3]